MYIIRPTKWLFLSLAKKKKKWLFLKSCLDSEQPIIVRSCGGNHFHGIQYPFMVEIISSYTAKIYFVGKGSVIFRLAKKKKKMVLLYLESSVLRVY